MREWNFFIVITILIAVTLSCFFTYLVFMEC